MVSSTPVRGVRLPLAVCASSAAAAADTVSEPTLDFEIEVPANAAADSLATHTDSLRAPAQSGPSGRVTVTPVDRDRKKPRQPVLHYYDRHGDLLPEPVLFVVEEKDTTVTPRSPYPLYNGISVGLDFGDVVTRLCGQSYGSYGLTASVSLHNWFFPTLEVGAGHASHHPEGANYRYKAAPTPYVKLGIDYNFLYKSNPAYQAYIGLRGGWSHTSYSITGISLDSDYWQDSQHPDLEAQRAHALFGEAVAGIRVRIAGHFSLGWRGQYHFMFKKSEGSNSTPWFFPGYGASNAVGFQLTAYWDF